MIDRYIGELDSLRSIPELEMVLTGPDVADRFELPPDRIGDIVLLSSINMTIGSSRNRHDLGALDRPLRSHGGLSEQVVPFVVNRKVCLPAAPALRNLDALYCATKAASIPPNPGRHRDCRRRITDVMQPVVIGRAGSRKRASKR